MLHGTILKDDFLAQRSIATLLRHCFECLQHCSNISTLCCPQNRRCESSRVTSPRASSANSLVSLVDHILRVIEPTK